MVVGKGRGKGKGKGGKDEIEFGDVCRGYREKRGVSKLLLEVRATCFFFAQAKGSMSSTHGQKWS